MNSAADHLNKFHGLDPKVASDRLHEFKARAGLPPDANAIIGRTGDVYRPTSHEYLGNLITGH